jgi:hypothetical protein
MLNVNQKARITADEIADHPWFLINPILKSESLPPSPVISSTNLIPKHILSTNSAVVKEDLNKSLTPIGSVNSKNSIHSNHSASSGYILFIYSFLSKLRI